MYSTYTEHIGMNGIDVDHSTFENPKDESLKYGLHASRRAISFRRHSLHREWVPDEAITNISSIGRRVDVGDGIVEFGRESIIGAVCVYSVAAWIDFAVGMVERSVAAYG